MARTVAKKNHDPEASCDDGTCCGTNGYQYKFITTLENVSADYGNYGLWLKNSIDNIKGVLVCSNSLSKVQGLSSTYIPNDPNPRYKYQVWGNLYKNPSIIGFGPEPLYGVRIEKIEIIN